MKHKGKRVNSTNNFHKETELDDYDESTKWFDQVIEDPNSFGKSTEQVIIELKDEAKKCHDSEVVNYNIKNSKTNSDYQWMKTVMSKGTISDKIAAHTVAIQDNPVCNLETIRNLVGMIKVGKKKECIVGIDTLTELFLSDLLRPDQKLKPFHQRPLSVLNDLSSGNAVTRRKILSTWYFEDQLKEIYAAYVLALNAAAQDTVENNKEKAISAMFKLLAGNPEQEKNLLTYIVNKLGDPSQKVASKAIYCLTQLLFKHANMQGVVLNEIEKLLFRSNISSRAQYYSLCFLSQFYLSHEASDVARKLVELYFSFFKACVKKGDVDSRMMSALLMGINRAYPYAKMELDKISEHIDTMYRLVHIANFNISLHALTILYQVSDYGNSINERFYSALYKKLSDPKLLTTTHQAMLLSLIYKALMKDKEVNRIKMFVKRLLQISLVTQPGFTCGILYLVSQLIGKKEHLLSVTLRQTTIKGLDDDDDEEERYHDVKDEVIDVDTEDIKIKEEIEETEIKHEEIDEDISKMEPTIDPRTIEIKDEEDVKPDVEIIENSLNADRSWYHCKNKIKKEKWAPLSKYNPLARNPLYGGGEFCAYTELTQLKNHFHPTVSLYASNIFGGETVKYSGDPLKDFTLIRFLDRFVFKNPKKLDEKTGTHPTFGKRKLYKPKGVKMLAVNSTSYLKENLENIPVDELFMYSYLQKKYEEKQAREEDEANSDLESVQSDEFEEMLDKMSGKNIEDDVDYLNEIGDNLKNKDKNEKGKDKQEDEDDEGSEGSIFDDEIDDDSFDDEELDEIDDEDKELIADLEDDEEDMEFIDDEKSSKSKKNKFKKKGDDLSSIFASAEEFATLLEDEGSSKVKPGGSNAYANKDNANVKQLAWEGNRNKWLKGFDKALGGGKGKNKKLGKKRPNQSKFSNKSKKVKK